ncbi:MATE family efflux transporter [Halocalculus aciditolerans]|uniref:Multidrug-efflux transporter n=1 Tax=Halocalculus aciditolerans TaxID=1383812 RepID=A0A830FNK8_9EURY|nr:MATE family efflux transporter [Halocalculus aciditolerans]GGL70852.1 MATE family efflux transporter [Halocalculus aciditolerans]
MSKRAKGELTEGSLLKPTLRLAWPLVVVQLLQVAYNLADTLWLGAYSPDAVGALSLAFPVVFLLISIGGGFTAAGSILVAQYTGADRDRDAGVVAGQTLWFVTLLAVVIAVLGHFLAGPALSLLPADPATKARVIPLAIEYMRTYFIGVPFIFGFFIFTSLLRGYGDTRTPMYVMLLTVFLNVVLDPLLIFGWGGFPELGVEGAALATVVSRVVAATVGLAVLFGTTRGPTVGLADLTPDVPVVRNIVRIGTPSAIEQSASSLAMVVLTAMVASFPPAVVAAYGVGNRLSSLVFLPALGLGQATNTVVGQNLGAKKPERAEQAVKITGGIVTATMLAVGVVAALFPHVIVAPFVTADVAGAAATLGHAADYLRVMSVMFVFTGLLQVVLGAFRGAGDTRTSMLLSLLSLWVVRVPATYVLAFALDWGANGLWWAVAVGDILGCLVAALWFTRGTWKNGVVSDRSQPDAAD